MPYFLMNIQNKHFTPIKGKLNSYSIMKKLLFILIGLILLIVAGLYIFIPGRITISKSITIEASQKALFRKLQNTESWREWWPAKKGEMDTTNTYSLNGFKFTPGPAKIISVPISIDVPEFTTSSELIFISTSPDVTTLQIETSIPVPYNPFKRVAIYFKTKKIENSFSEILQSINATYSKIANLYGYDIQKKSVVDSTLVFTFEETKGYPSVSKIYSLIDELRSYIKQNSAAETGFPMLNTSKSDSVNYIVKVAIPVNKKLPDSEKIHYRWMLGGGNILITEVKGGQNEITNAYKQIQNYVSDYNRSAPAIPFESLVTDRRKEPDSSKWITRIYYPVI